MMNMMKQAQELQKKLTQAQEELSLMNIHAIAGKDSVHIICDGKGIFKSIKLKPEALNSEHPENVSQDDIEILEDLITKAMETAIKQSQVIMNDKLKEATGGMNIPGLNF